MWEQSSEPVTQFRKYASVRFAEELTAHASFPAAAFTESHGCILCNEEFCQLVDMPHDSVIGSRVEAVFAGLKTGESLWERNIRPSCTLTVSIPSARGNITLDLDLLLDRNNKRIGLFLTFPNRTEHKNILTLSVCEKIQSTDTDVGVGFFLCHKNSKTAFWSDGLYKILEVEPGSLRPSSYSFFPYVVESDRDIWWNAKKRALKNGQDTSVFRIRTAQGTEKWVERRVVVKTDPVSGDTLIEGFLIDQSATDGRTGNKDGVADLSSEAIQFIETAQNGARSTEEW